MVSVIAFSIAIPLLAALVLVNDPEGFRGRRTRSVKANVARVVALNSSFVGLVAAFWNITRIAGVTFLTGGVVAAAVHSAGVTGHEQAQQG